MRKLQNIWLWTHSHDRTMLWAAACTVFLGFLQAGEFTVPSPTMYDPEVHLSLGDLSVDSHMAPKMVGLRIKQTKTNPFRQGVDIYIGATGGRVCPVMAIIRYFGVRNPTAGPLFILQSGTPLTQTFLVVELKKALEQVGIEQSRYNGHSFRIGAATMAARQGIEDSMIQTLGRWRSDAYKIYIRLPRAQLASISKTLSK